MDYYSTPAKNQVWSYDQVTEKMKGKITKRGQGFCAGLCVVWIKMRALGTDFEADGQGGVDVGKFLYEKVYAIQARMEEITGRGFYSEQLEPGGFNVKKALKLDTIDGQDYADTDLSSLVRRVDRTARKGLNWYLLRLQGAKSGHVVALEVENPLVGYWRYRLFDPNYGSVEFVGESGFKKWLVTNFFEGYRTTYTRAVKLHKLSPNANPLAIDVLQVESAVLGNTI